MLRRIAIAVVAVTLGSAAIATDAVARGGGGHGGGGMGGSHFGGGFGGGGPGTSKRYNLTFTVNARNVFNIVNGATPIGVLTSPNFGKSIALATGPFSSAAANRKIELQASFTF